MVNEPTAASLAYGLDRLGQELRIAVIDLGGGTLDEGLVPAPRGMPKIEVTFDIDANGILNVAARDTATGKSQSIRITGSTRLPEADKERMVKEAERYAEQDRKRRDEAEKLNNADS